MGLNYDARLRLRRLAGVLVPVLLLPAAVWFYAVTPPAALADPPSGVDGLEGPSVVQATGVVVRATALPDGSFDVVETVRLSDPVVQVRLAVPDLTAAGPAFGDLTATYADVRVVADEEEVPVTGLLTALSVPLPAPATVLEVRYRVSGVAVRTVPSPDGRALGALAPLVVVDAVVGFEVDGPAVRTVTCPMLPPERTLCAVGRGAGFVVDPQPFADALVLAQLDLGA